MSDLETGMRTRREVLGDEYVDRAMAAAGPFDRPFQELITRYAWGEIWGSDGLTRGQRSIVTLTALASLRHWNELGMHVKAAIRNGLTREEIQQVLLQVAVYAGVPVGNHAFAIAQAALDEIDASGASGASGA